MRKDISDLLRRDESEALSFLYRHLPKLLASAIGTVLFLCMFSFWSFGAYIRNVGSHWLVLMAGIVSVAITFYEKIAQSEVGKYTLYVVAALCVFFAGFQAWQDQAHSAVDKQAQIDYLSKPDFVIDSQTESSQCSNELTTTFLAIRITNHGADSAVMDYRTYYQSSTTNGPIQVKQFMVPSESVLFKVPNGGWLKIPPSDFIYNKTGVIHRGDSVVGRIPLQIPGNCPNSSTSS